jgi:hypothetical protein
MGISMIRSITGWATHGSLPIGGYTKNRNMAGAPQDLTLENPSFDATLVIEV